MHSLRASILKRTLPLALLLLVLALPARAEVRFGDDRELMNLSTQNSYRTWRIEDSETGDKTTVRQFSSRLFSTWELGETTDLVLYGAAGATQNRDASVAEVAGLADVKMKLFQQAWDGKLLLGLGMNLPTGQTDLNDDEVSALRAVSPNVLGFRLRHLGEGFDIDAGAALGIEVGSGWTVGGGISYLLKGAYDLDSGTEYDAGGEIALTAGADLRRGAWISTFDMVYRVYGTDQINGDDSFEEGSQLELTWRANWRQSRWGMDMFAKDVIKSENAFIVPDAPPGTDSRVDNGNNFWFGLHPVYQPNPLVAFRALFDFVAVNASQQQETSAWAMGLGLGVDLRLTPAAILEMRLARLSGGDEDNSFDLSGFDGIATVRWQY